MPKFKLLIFHIFDINEHVARRIDGTDEFVLFQKDCASVSILHVLDEEDHEESDDSGSRVDDELPRIREVENRTRDRPHDDNKDGNNERPRRSHFVARPVRDLAEQVVHTGSIARL